MSATLEIQDNRNHAVQIGMILVGSWGWEQTNVDFFEVVELIGKATLKVKAIGYDLCDEDGYSSMASNVVANREKGSGETFRVRVSVKGRMVNPKGYNSYLRVWNGDPVYASWYA